MIPAGQELMMTMARGLGFSLSMAVTVSVSFCIPPNTMSSSFISVDMILGESDEGSSVPLSKSLRLPAELNGKGGRDVGTECGFADTSLAVNGNFFQYATSCL